MGDYSSQRQQYLSELTGTVEPAVFQAAYERSVAAALQGDLHERATVISTLVDPKKSCFLSNELISKQQQQGWLMECADALYEPDHLGGALKSAAHLPDYAEDLLYALATKVEEDPQNYLDWNADALYYASLLVEIEKARSPEEVRHLFERTSDALVELQTDLSEAKAPGAEDDDGATDRVTNKGSTHESQAAEKARHQAKALARNKDMMRDLHRLMESHGVQADTLTAEHDG